MWLTTLFHPEKLHHRSGKRPPGTGRSGRAEGPLVVARVLAFR